MEGGGRIIRKSAMAFRDWGAKHGLFFGVVGGGIGIAFLVQSSRDKMKSKIAQRERDQEQLERDLEFYKEQLRAELEAKAQQMEAKMQAKLQEVRAKQEQQFLRYAEADGFGEEYKAYLERIKKNKDEEK